MKATLIVFVALAAVASASVLPWGWDGLHGGLGLSGLGLGGLGLAGHGLSGVGIAPWGLGANIIQQNALGLHAPVVAAGAVPHGAVSVNANRGSVHVAPLPGHIASSSQLNLAPAPGTW